MTNESRAGWVRVGRHGGSRSCSVGMSTVVAPRVAFAKNETVDLRLGTASALPDPRSHTVPVGGIAVARFRTFV